MDTDLTDHFATSCKTPCKSDKSVFGKKTVFEIIHNK